MDRDGTKNGYDVELTRLVAENVSIPVIASEVLVKGAFLRGCKRRES